MRTIAERQALALAWRLAATAGETQQSFCARQTPPVSARALRDYLRRYAPIEPPLEAALGVIDRAIADLTQLRASIALQRSTASTSIGSAPSPPTSVARSGRAESGPIPMPPSQHPIWLIGR
jgi:hypothetical protein